MAYAPIERIPYAKNHKKISDNAVQFFIEGEVVKSGWWLWLLHTCEYDEDNDFDGVRIGRGTDQYEVHWWESHEDCTAGVLYWMDKPTFFIPPGQKLIVRFDGTTVGDHLYVTVDGYYIPHYTASDASRREEVRRELLEKEIAHWERMEKILGGCEGLLTSLWDRYNALSNEEALKIRRFL